MAAQSLALPGAFTVRTAPVGNREPSLMDEAAFHAFYGRTAVRLRAYLARSCGNDWSLADDLIQDAYYRFLRSGFASDDEQHCKNYLYRIATNLVRDHFRRRRRVGERTVALDDGAELPARPAPSAHLGLDLGPLLERLKPRDRQLLWLAHVEGLSHEEIAATLGIQGPSVRSMLFRARGRLAALLAERGLDEGVLP